MPDGYPDVTPIVISHREYAFTVNIQSDGKVSLTIRTDEESTLERLLDKWESRVVVFHDQPRNNTKQNNGAKNGDRNADKAKYFPGDTCPECSNKLVRRQGSKGRFLGCNNYPDCTFVQGL